MKLFLDTANLAEIREIAAWGVLAGVTTNPSLIAKEGRDPQSLWIGVLFGVALLGTAFALSDAISAAIASVVAILVVSAYFRLNTTRAIPPPNT